MSLYRDIEIKNGDVVLDAGQNQSYLTDRSAIAQDIANSIIENGLAHLLVGDRGTGIIADTKIKIKLLVEEDIRVLPGTVQVNQLDNGQWWVFAETIDFGPLSTSIETGVE